MPNDVVVFEIGDPTKVRLGVSKPEFIISDGNNHYWVPIAMYEYFQEDADEEDEQKGVAEVAKLFAENIGTSKFQVVMLPPGLIREEPQQTNL